MLSARRSGSHPTAAWPLPAVGVLAASVLGLVLTCAVGTTGGVLPPVELGLALGAVTATWWILRWRSRQARAEQVVWRMFSLGCLLYGAGAVATAGLVVLPQTAAFGDLPGAVCAALTFPLAYRALVRWSRNGSGVDPDDLLNGTGAVLVVIAITSGVLSWHARSTTGGLLLTSVSPTQQLLVVQNAAVLVLLGAALTAAFVGRLHRDPRVWLVTAAYLLAGAGGFAALLDGGDRPAWSGPVWALGLSCLAAAALLPVRFVPTQASDPVKSTVGSFVVVLAGLGTAAAVVATSAPGSLALVALVGVLGSSVRLLVNLKELALLAVSRTEALTDDLTGIANRRALQRHLDHLLAVRSGQDLTGRPRRAPTQGGGVQVVVFDLDHFKEVNDSLGHSAGDDLLRMLTQRLQPALPTAAVFGRLGGDEFVIVSDDGRAGQRVLEVLDRACGEPFPLAGMGVHVDLSIGRTTWSPEALDAGSTIEAGADAVGGPVDAATLLRRADTAMYDAKRNERQLVTYDPGRHGETRGLLAMVGELRHAITAGQLRVHYQPQLHTSTGRLAGVEALVRWEHPVLGLLMPGQFLPLAQSHALMDAVTRDVLRRAVAQQAAWRRSGLDVRMSVNLSAGTLLDVSLPAAVQTLLAEHDVPATCLVLEVTETALLREPDRSLAVVEGLRALGVQVSIDDFGTGYSSLTQLRQLPVSELKLDRSFTVDLLSDPRAAAIVANTISLAHDLHLRVVAEGVEDEATLAALAGLVCDETQGYLHAKPLPAAEFDRWLLGHRPRVTAAAGLVPVGEPARR